MATKKKITVQLMPEDCDLVHRILVAAIQQLDPTSSRLYPAEKVACAWTRERVIVLAEKFPPQVKEQPVTY